MPESEFVNRELSWLEFDQRVLDEAADASNPPLERLKFLAISASNLDEFFMVRVGGLMLLRDKDRLTTDPSGMTVEEQLAAIRDRVLRIMADQYACLLDELEPLFVANGIQRVDGSRLDAEQKTVLEKLFESEVFPVHTPMAVAADEEFPLLVNRALNIVVRLAPEPGGGEPRFAVIPLSMSANRFIELPSQTGRTLILLEDAVRAFGERFFPGETVLEITPFRLTRNADMSVRDDLAFDLVAGIEQVLDQRKQSEAVRLEVSDAISDATLGFLQLAMHVEDTDVYRARGPLDLGGFMRLTNVPGLDKLRYEAWPPRPSPDVDLATRMFDVLRQQDLLLLLPYESFEPVIRLIDEAADDPDVLAIKITLYRTSGTSPIVLALRRASERGKHVTAIVELKARFDEARNLDWARRLENAGVQVIYGVRGLKTHAKVCIIIRRETHGIQRYVHFSTGNYNEVTARLYSDACLMTCNEELASDATNLFNAITGYSQPQQFQKIAAAPLNLRQRLLELIDSEIDRRQQGQTARIMAQVNSLTDEEVIRALYRASQAGVEIDLNVRGICCLRPGVPGLSDNIRAVSILDRFLEHSRILYFHHGGDELVFISSADWMSRSLDRRVELLIPVENRDCKERLIGVLDSYACDDTKGRRLTPDGGFQRPDRSRATHRHQQHLYELAGQAAKQKEQSRRTVFLPHRAPGTDV